MYAYETAAQCDSNGVPVGVCGTQGGVLHKPLEQILELLNPVTSPLEFIVRPGGNPVTVQLLMPSGAPPVTVIVVFG